MIPDELLTVRNLCNRALVNKFARARTITIADGRPRIVHIVLQGKGERQLGYEELIRSEIAHAAGVDAEHYVVLFDWEQLG